MRTHPRLAGLPRRLLTGVPVLLLAAHLAAQSDRELSAETATYWSPDMTPAAINALASQGWRITHLDLESTSPLEFTVAMVQNTGPYRIDWAWYPSVDARTLGTLLSQNQARLVDLEPYDLGGQTRFAAVMVNNTGANARAWGWLYNTTTSAIAQNCQQYNNRIVDLDRYTVGGSTYYSAVLTSNTGSDTRTWWFGVNLSSTQVTQQVNANQAQLVDIERNGSNYDVVMQRVPGSPKWWYYFGLTAGQVTETLSQLGGRLADIEQYTSLLQSRFNIVVINNSNPLSTRIGEILRGTTDGVVGAYLKQVNGPVLAYLNADHNFEPASSIKVMFHAHAVKRVQARLSLATMLQIPFQSNGCYVFPSSTLQSLQVTLGRMMQESHNPSTVAVQNYFTNDAINQTLHNDLQLTHTNVLRFLCQSPLNESTLTDFGRLHESIANGWLNPSHRALFYDLMNHDLTYGGVINVSSLIDQEAAALSLPTVVRDEFKAQCAIAWKAGSWNRGPGLIHWSTFDWMRLPFRTGLSVAPREYVSGVFVDFASSDPNAANAMNQAKRELVRDVVREALTTWRNYVPGSFVPFGAGCPGSGGIPRIGAVGTPLPGRSTTLTLSGARASSVAVLDVGFSNTWFLGAPLPLSLAAFGAPGCSLLCDVALSASVPTSATGTAQTALGLPNLQAAVGAVLYGQWLVVDQAANALGLTVSDSGALTVGGYR